MNFIRRLPKPLKRIQWKYRTLLWQYHQRFTHSMMLKTQQGIFIIPFRENDAISRHLYTRREYESEWIVDSLALLRNKQLCPAKGQGTVLDIGANCGVVSIGLLARGEFEQAIAIEPGPRNFELLRGNVAVNGLEDRLICLNVAAADAKSELEFELSECNYGDHRVRCKQPDPRSRELFNESQRRVINVQADTIDNLLDGLGQDTAQQVSLVWIDVQGYEGYVFRGAAGLLSRGVPVVSEIWPYGIERAGMSLETYCEIVSGIWSTYWSEQRGKITQHPIGDLPKHLAKLARGVKHENVIYAN